MSGRGASIVQIVQFNNTVNITNAFSNSNYNKVIPKRYQMFKCLIADCVDSHIGILLIRLQKHNQIQCKQKYRQTIEIV